MTISRAEAIRRLSQVVPLERENGALRTTICCLQRELTDKEGHLGRLRFLLSERLRKIDDLNGKLEQARAQLRKLDSECEHLAELFKG